MKTATVTDDRLTEAQALADVERSHSNVLMARRFARTAMTVAERSLVWSFLTPEDREILTKIANMTELASVATA